MAIAQPIRGSIVFYGWYIVALAFLGYFLTGAMGYTIGVYMKPVGNEFEWSRGTITGALTVGQIVQGFVAIFIGGRMDRHGGRSLMIFGALVTGIGYIALGFIQELWHFYLILATCLAVGSTCFGGFIVNVAVSNWFIRKRGRALAIAGMGVSFGGVILGPLAQMLIDRFGWRSSWMAMGVLIWLVMLAPTALLMRRRPEDMGLRPDGDIAGGPEPKAVTRVQRAAARADLKWTRTEAVHTRTFWTLVAAFAITGLGHAAIQIHAVPYASDLGFAPSIAATVLSAQAITALAFKPFWGFLLERIESRYVCIMAVSCAMAGMLLFLTARSLEMLYLSLAIFGIGAGGHPPIQEATIANYFGRLSLGTVRSVSMPIISACFASGALVAGLLYDFTGSYREAFLLFIGLYTLAMLLFLLLRPPKQARSCR